MEFSSGFVCDRERGDCVVLRQYRVGRRREEFLLAMTSTSEHRGLVRQVDEKLFESGRRFLRTGRRSEFERVVRSLIGTVNETISGCGGFAMLICLGDQACVSCAGDHAFWVEGDRLGHHFRRQVGEACSDYDGIMLDVITIPEDVRLEIGTRNRETTIWIDVR